MTKNEAFTESAQRSSQIIDFLPDATFAIDTAGKVIAWNRAIEEMTGVSAEEMLGKGDYEYKVTVVILSISKMSPRILRGSCLVRETDSSLHSE